MLSDLLKGELNRLKEDGWNVDNVDFDLLLSDIEDEYRCGGEGMSIREIIMDLNDTVGLEDYGLEFPE